MLDAALFMPGVSRAFLPAATVRCEVQVFDETAEKRWLGTVRPSARWTSPVMPQPRLATIESKDAKKRSPIESMRTPSSAEKARDLGRTDLVAKEILRITDALRQRLDQHTLSRKVFPQLAVLERELKRSGYLGLSRLPVELLDAALEQLVFITGRIPGELCTLRAKVLEAVFARAPAAGDFGSHVALSMLDAPHEVQVTDATESAFFHAEEEWAAAKLGTRPQSPL